MSKKTTTDDGPKRARKRNKKPKDMPKRPLSAYNLFFADERERILSAQREGIEQDDFILPTEEEAERQKQQGKKRAPVLFQALARCVGKRWSAVREEDKKKYEAQAEEEMKKYRIKMEDYQQNIVMNTMAQSAKQKRKKDKSESCGDSLEDSSPGRAPKKAKANKSNAGGQSANNPLLSQSAMDGSQLGAVSTSRTATGLSFLQANAGGAQGISGLSQMAQQQQFQQSNYLQSGLGGSGGGSSGMDSNTASLFSSQFGASSGLGTGGTSASGASSLLPHYQQYSPFLQQQQNHQNQGLAAAMPGMQSQQSNASLLEQIMLQRQQQQAAAFISGAMGSGSPSDLLAFQLQQQPPQQVMQSGNQAALFNYLANQQQPQQQQQYLMGGQGSLGGVQSASGAVGGMDVSNASSMHDFVHQQQQQAQQQQAQQQQAQQQQAQQQQAQQQRAGAAMWDTEGSSVLGASDLAGVGGAQDGGGLSSSQQHAYAFLQPQLQHLLLPQDQQQQQAGIQALFGNNHQDHSNVNSNADDHHFQGMGGRV